MLADIQLWGRRIGAIRWDAASRCAAFQYAEDFIESGIEVAPLQMPLRQDIYRFPNLPRETFSGLPGLVADSLPDKFGHALIDSWLAAQGRRPADFNPVERLCYIGKRGMGALEFSPGLGPRPAQARKIEIDALVSLATEILSQRKNLQGSFASGKRESALKDILRVGTSAGGARAKAIIAWNRETNEVRSGQIESDSFFEYWLLKFDGVSGNRDKELEDPQGYGAVEYAYYLMAKAAGIQMSECRLLEENGRRHFMTKRFDRRPDGSKLHMQSLGALAHYDFNAAGAHSYEQAFLTMRQLGLAADSVEAQFRRMVFNIVARNQDDHVKNIAFLMNQAGQWALAPAYDVTFSYNPDGDWTARHQMSVNGKRDHFTLTDLEATAQQALLKRGTARRIYTEVSQAVRQWPEYAGRAGVTESWIEPIGQSHRVHL
ncbi:MAG: type II toxin-antitoxin system HipA family toxin [Puniceicoccaceae bacterium]|nr:MAG: type II toxin-antitoxin system HipA family toxin [Puniceicoccaceae bacterium]